MYMVSYIRVLCLSSEVIKMLKKFILRYKTTLNFENFKENNGFTICQPLTYLHFTLGVIFYSFE